MSTHEDFAFAREWGGPNGPAVGLWKSGLCTLPCPETRTLNLIMAGQDSIWNMGVGGAL